jgi:hypothetical protein
MLVLRRGQRAVIADKVADVANLAVGALVFGQALTESFSVLLALLGLALWACLMTWVAVLAGGAEP